jgi:hypothetical protein
MVMQERVLEPEHRARWGPACGVAFVVVLAVTFLVFGNTPNTDKTPLYVWTWYQKNSHKTQVGISLVLSDIAIVFGIFFFGYLRDRWGRTDLGARLAPILLVGAGVFATGGLVFNGALIALLDEPKHMSVDTAQTLNFLQSDLGAAALVVGVSILMWAAAVIIWKTRILPFWLAIVSVVLALVALAGPLGFFAFFAMGIWILIVAFMMWRFEETLPVGGEGMTMGPEASGAVLDDGPFPRPGTTIPPSPDPGGTFPPVA